MKESPWKRKRLKFHHRFCFFNSNNNTNKCLETQILRLIKTRNKVDLTLPPNSIFFSRLQLQVSREANKHALIIAMDLANIILNFSLMINTFLPLKISEKR